MTCEEFDAVMKDCVLERKRNSTDAEAIACHKHVMECDKCHLKVIKLRKKHEAIDPERVRRGIKRGGRIIKEIKAKQDPEL